MNIHRLPANAALAILRAYKWAVSPMLPPSCRYTPTCSEYAAEAIETFGLLRGSVLAAWRLLRCHPFVKGGFDPVPNGASLRETLRIRSGEACEGARLPMSRATAQHH